MNYLAGWRMQVATQKLRNTNVSLAQIVDMVGYHSAAAFLRAFKKAGRPGNVATFKLLQGKL